VGKSWGKPPGARAGGPLPTHRRFEEHGELPAELLDLRIRIFESETQVCRLCLGLRGTSLDFYQTLKQRTVLLSSSHSLKETGQLLNWKAGMRLRLRSSRCDLRYWFSTSRRWRVWCRVVDEDGGAADHFFEWHGLLRATRSDHVKGRQAVLAILLAEPRH
jgi:hypothetical protein